MPKATIAIEDRRFYEHGGIDAEGIARALWKNVSAGRGRRGRLDDHAAARPQPLHLARADRRAEAEGGVPRAQARHDAWTKSGSSPRYMNQVYYGNLAYGIEAAAQTYFSKPAATLNLPEAALLAGLPQAPSAYDPFNRTEIATVRRNQVLRAMLDEGADQAGPVRLGARAAARPEGREALHDDPRAVLLQLRPRRADRRVRRRDRALGRAQGLHDDRPALPAGGAEGDPRDALRARPIPPPRSSRSTRRTAPSAR